MVDEDTFGTNVHQPFPVEIIDRLRNKKRKLMLIEIYKYPKRYNELVDITGLKPGSIYHHLKILEPLIRKSQHGLYEITDYGKNVVEQLHLVKFSDQKPEVTVDQDNLKTPKIKKSTSTQYSNIKANSESYEIKNNKNEILDQSDLISKEFQEENFILRSLDTLSDTLLLGKYNLILLVFIILISILLANQGVALAGSTIYSVGYINAYYFSISAFMVGWAIIYIIEDIFFETKTYNLFYSSLNIRLISMLPGSLIGLSLFLLYENQVYPNQLAYVIIFIVSALLGLILSTYSIYYLRARNLIISLRISIFITLVDVLIGFVVLLTKI